MFTQRYELLSFLDARINVLKAKHFLSVTACLKPVTDRQPWKIIFYAQIFVLAEFLVDFPFKNFTLFWPLSFGNRSKRIVQLSWLSLCISLRKGQIDRSKGQRADLFVNGRKEDVKFSRINCFASLFGIIRICHIDECGSKARERFTTPYRRINLLVLSFNRSVFCQWIILVFKIHRTASLFKYKLSP